MRERAGGGEGARDGKNRSNQEPEGEGMGAGEGRETGRQEGPKTGQIKGVTEREGDVFTSLRKCLKKRGCTPAEHRLAAQPQNRKETCLCFR